MVSIWVREPPVAPGDHNALKFVPEVPKAPAKPLVGSSMRPHFSHGTPAQSQRIPKFTVRFLVTLKSSLMKPLASRCSKAAREGYTIHCGFLPLATPKPCAIDETEPVRSVSIPCAKVSFCETSPGSVLTPDTAVLPAPKVTAGVTLLLML